MLPDADEATARFLESAADDLQQQLSVTGTVEEVTMAEAPRGVWLTARLRIGGGTVEISAYGESLVAAYAELHIRVGEPALVAAYRELVNA
jgi:hypothetical protein